MRGWRRYLLDALTAVGLTTLFLVAHTAEEQEAAGSVAPLDPRGVTLLIGCGLLFAGRSRWPRAYAVTTMPMAFAYIALDYAPGPIYLAPFLALYVLLPVVSRRLWLPVVVVAGVGFVTAVAGWGGGPVGDTAFASLVWFGGAGALAVAVYLHQQRIAAITARAETAEQEAARGAAEERLRMAREVHDVVAHKLATISLQAGVAVHLDRSGAGGPQREALTAIRGLANDALGELRAVLGAAPSGLRPAAALADLPDLVDAIRAAGLPVEAQIDLADVATWPDAGPPGGAAPAVPDVVALASYRLVQEALTNVARHAGPGAAARLRVCRTGTALEVEVRSHGQGGPGGLPGGGRGLVGMRERARTLGGAFAAGPEADGGFRVWALLPLAVGPDHAVPSPGGSRPGAGGPAGGDRSGAAA
ncbi:Signal transduction histidine kinase [Micromonospora phaseoli]|uniref:histidine kinase n=1 Tax=Micromonospora phaseoli TaxID=1144548 RepID=A0A1H7DYH5_9ACTN|nr:histidine kinase [Micromonospora phaseoli]PZV88980.1 signal transduction histidine kinase [Micromonospora phaseoli]GIJ80974.1 two-component sensor histidine kinase [Micromonospora phaseoli]SEK06464.1 Signal transduction histidine kinase [Micromonospora phaseoli]